MAFVIPSLSETRDFVIAVGKAVFPDRNYGNLRSYLARRATFLAAAVTQLHAHISSVQDDVMPDSASDGAPINRWGTITGTDRKSATAARKSSAGRVYGVAATAVDAGEELLHQASGLRYEIATSTTIGGSGYVDADIVAIDTGSQTKIEAGQILQFVSTPAGLQTGVVLQADLDEDGYDDEAFGAYRKRVLATFSEPTAGGTDADYVAWMLEIEGVSSAFCYANRAGLGTVDVLALHTGSGTARELDSGDQEEVLEYLEERAPSQVAGVNGSLRHLDVVIDEQDVELVLDPNGEAAYAFDWTGGPMTVATWTSATRTLEFTADRPASMKAGHRIVLKGVGSAQDGTEYTIEALGAADDEIILEEAPTVDPVATDLVYSGGPLTTPIRDAIVAHMNGEDVYAGRNRIPRTQGQLDEDGESVVGLEVLAEGIGPANPDGAYGAWNGSLLRSLLFQIAMYKAGVRNVTISTPAADVDAEDYEFPLDEQIGLIAPGSVLVRGST
jgi:uncharacterized phage protein gp47/JayE